MCVHHALYVVVSALPCSAAFADTAALDPPKPAALNIRMGMVWVLNGGGSNCRFSYPRCDNAREMRALSETIR